MINERSAKEFCCEDFSLIENYDKAVADQTQTWHIHHRRESIYSRNDLIAIDEYYNRPAIELIFLTQSAHNKVHKTGVHHSEETRKKISEAEKGERNYNFGKHLSEDTRRKISEAEKGKLVSEITRKKLSKASKGRYHTEESKKKMSKSHKGKHFWNNGVVCVRTEKCPEGFTLGMLKRSRKPSS